MKTYDVTCPICGTINHNLYLEETQGWMECENCGSIVSFGDPVSKEIKIPVYAGKQDIKLLSTP